MRRNKRSLHQLQQTVKMKIAVIQQQKDDLVDILNDFTSTILLEAEQALSPECGSQPQYQATLEQLDKVSQLFTNLASHIDSTLYADEDDNSETPVNGAAGDASKLLQTKSSNVASEQQHRDVCESSIQQRAEDTESSRTQTACTHVSERRNQCQDSTNVKPSSPQVEEQQLCHVEEYNNALQEMLYHEVVKDEDQEVQTYDIRRNGGPDLGQCADGAVSSNGADTNISSRSSLPDNFDVSNKKPVTSKGNMSNTVTDIPVTKKQKHGKSKKKNKGDQSDALSEDVCFPQNFPAHSSPPEVELSCCNASETSSSSEREAQFTPIPQSSSLQDQHPPSSERYVGAPYFLPTNSNVSQTLFQPPVQPELLIPTGRGQPHYPYVLSQTPGWAPLLSNQPEPLSIHAPGLHRSPPFLNMVNPTYPAANLSLVQNGFPESANLFLGSNLYHQPPILNTVQPTTVSSLPGSVFNLYNNGAPLGQPLWYGARPNFLPQVNGFGASQVMPPRPGVLVQSPMITSATPSPEPYAQVPEVFSNSSHGNAGVLSHPPAPTVIEAENDPEVEALSHSCYSTLDKESGNLTQYSENSAFRLKGNVTPVECTSTRDAHFTPYNSSSQSQRSCTLKEEDQKNTAQEFRNGQVKGTKDRSRAPSPSVSESSSIGSESRPRSGARPNFPPQIRKPKKLMDVPDDLKAVIKQALQEKQQMESEKAGSTVVEELQVAQQTFKKDEISVVIISSIEDPWAFYAQTGFRIQDISTEI
ncbi:hypothetical protein EGW08_015204, partial [Elysia chlorotica]